MQENAPVVDSTDRESGVRWKTPGYQVVETSLEVTMYVSATR